MGETAEALARYRRARTKPRRSATEAEFRRACKAQGWAQEQIEDCIAKARPGTWFEVGEQLLRVKPSVGDHMNPTV